MLSVCLSELYIKLSGIPRIIDYYRVECIEVIWDFICIFFLNAEILYSQVKSYLVEDKDPLIAHYRIEFIIRRFYFHFYHFSMLVCQKPDDTRSPDISTLGIYFSYLMP